MAQDVASKDLRVRDPVHGLITFDPGDEFETLIFHLINAREFQRLRRIKQLGFSELVYPGATHTRFSHSLGVFHTARTLVKVFRSKLKEDFSEERARIAVCAALLHDVGHGPFSHAFESVLKKLGKPLKHERWTVRIVRGETEIGECLKANPEFQNEVASLLEQEYPTDIYSSIVSSQFDADRLDYLQRDRKMTGTEHGGFDWDWLLHNLEIDRVTFGVEPLLEVDGLVLGPKAIQSAEEYLVGRFHLYVQVYLHKTTRAAEKMLGAMLGEIASLVTAGKCADTSLPEDHPLPKFFATYFSAQEGSESDEVLNSYINLDDSVVWGSLAQLQCSKNETIAELAARIQNRNLYKCFDVGAKAESVGGNSRAKFRLALRKAIEAKEFGSIDVLEDETNVTPYKIHDYEDEDALSTVLVRRNDGSRHFEDIGKLSEVVRALGEKKIYRLYARTPEVYQALETMWRGIAG